MGEKVLDYYNGKCGIYNAVTKHFMSIRYITFFMYFLIAAISVLIYLFVPNVFVFVFGVIGCISSIIIGYYIEVSKIKIKLKEDFGIEVNGINWNTSTFRMKLYESDRRKLEYFLNGYDWNDKEHIIRIISEVEEYIDAMTPKDFVVPTFFAGLILSLFHTSSNWLFDRYSELEHFFYPLAFSVLILLLILGTYSIFKGGDSFINERLFWKKQREAKKCKKRLEEILFNMNCNQK